MKLFKLVALVACRILVITGVLICILLVGTQARSAAADSPAFVRIIHASPAVGTADVFVDGTKLLSALPFGMVTNYAAIPPGSHNVQLALIGKGPGAAVITESLQFTPGLAYTVAAVGTSNTNLALVVITDNNQLTTGMAKVRVYHLSPGTGTVNLLDGNQALVNGLGYEGVSNYLTFAPGSYSFTIVSSLTGDALPSVSASLKANMITSIFVVGVVNGTPPFQFIVSQTPGLPGVPQTGSDPSPGAAGASTQPQPISPWLPVIPAVVLIAIGAFMLRRKANG